jgi:hypothetical protein
MTTAYTLPDLHIPIRELLLADAEFAALVGGRIGSRAPDQVNAPYAVIRCSANPLSASSRSVGWLGGVQLHGCAAQPVNDVSPEQIAWKIAAAGARILDRSGQQIWVEPQSGGRSVTYTPRVTDGPLPMDPDKTRGPDTVIYWVFVRATFPIHLR